MVVSNSNRALEKIDVVAEYHKHNKETIEVISRRDPVTRAIYYKRISTDPNAVIFAKKFIKKGRIINESSKSPQPKKEPKAKSEKIIKPKDAVQLTIKKVPIAKKEPQTRSSGFFRKNSMASEVFNLLEKNLTEQEIADKLGKTKRAIQSMIYHRKVRTGELILKKDIINPVKKLLLEGKTVEEISQELNIAERNVSYYIDKINSLKTPEEISIENDEILEAIKIQMKEHKKDYCYSQWVNKANYNLKSMITSPVRMRRCLQLVKEGKLTIDDSGKSRQLGTMYRLP